MRGNGGVLSTTGDLYKWHQALEGEAILSREAKTKLFTPHVPEDEEGSSHYGYGWARTGTVLQIAFKPEGLTVAGKAEAKREKGQ